MKKPTWGAKLSPQCWSIRVRYRNGQVVTIYRVRYQNAIRAARLLRHFDARTVTVTHG